MTTLKIFYWCDLMMESKLQCCFNSKFDVMISHHIAWNVKVQNAALQEP